MAFVVIPKAYTFTVPLKLEAFAATRSKACMSAEFTLKRTVVCLFSYLSLKGP